jgi:DNA-binding CsgD family transcriptional regulator
MNACSGLEDISLHLESLPFSTASELRFEQRSRYIKPNTVRSYRCALKVLKPFFGETLVREIEISDIRRYQLERRNKAGGYLINRELSVLQMILKEARQWRRIEELYISRKTAKRSCSRGKGEAILPLL